jgi:hypothetical protein
MVYVLFAKKDIIVYDTIKFPQGYSQKIANISEGDPMYAASLVLLNDSNYYWHVWVDSMSGYVKENPDNIKCPDSVREEFKKANPKYDSLRLHRANKLMMYIKLTKKIEILELELKKRKVGLALNDWSWDYPNEYSSFTDVSFTLTNYSPKTIKYIWFYLNAYDAVGGKLTNYGKSTIILKGVGPIPFENEGTYSFENVFYSKIVHKMKIIKIKCQYMDNTFKEYVGNNLIIE